MAKSSNQKMKILLLLRLFQEAGENKVFSMQNVIDFLAEHGIAAERKSIYDDLEVLRQFGMDIRFRKERPSGYYLAGESSVYTEAEPVKTAGEKTEKEPKIRIVKEKVIVTQLPEWMKEEGILREVKLLCSAKGRMAAVDYLGENCTVREKENGSCLVIGETVIGAAFYGWLTALAHEVCMVKPRKEAAAYRDYIKAVAKEYKGIIQ